MINTIITCILLISFVEAKLAISENPNHLADYVKTVYENFTVLDHGYVAVIVNEKKTSTVDKSLKFIHKNALNPIFLMNFNDLESAEREFQRVKTQKYYFGYLKMMIVFLELKNSNISIVLANLQAMPIYRRRCRILLIFDDFIKTDFLKQLFSYLWTKLFLNIAIAFNLHDTVLQVYTYNPFLKEDDTLQNFTDIRFEQNIFYNKLKNLNKYKLTCMILRDDDSAKINPLSNNGNATYDGYDPEIVQNLVNYMNGSVDFITVADLLKPGERNPWRYTNDIEQNVLERKRKLIKENEIDMLNTDEMVLNDDFTGVTESLYPHDIDNLVFVLRRGEKIPYYKYLFMIFNFSIWLILIFNLILTIGFSTLVVYILKIPWLMNYLNLFRPVICSAVPKLPIINSERIFFMFWFLYCFITAMTFQSILTSMLMQPKYYPDIKTLEKLEESGLKMTLFRSMKVEITKALNGTSKYGLVSKIADMPEKFDNANYSHNNFTTEVFDNPIVLPYHRAVFLTRFTPYCKKGKELLNIIPESPLPRYLTFQVASGSPYLTALDEALTRFIEAGHLIHWRNKWEHYYVIKHIIIAPYISNKKKQTSEYNHMTIEHLYSAFIILLTGQLISLFVFIVELCNKPISNLKKK